MKNCLKNVRNIFFLLILFSYSAYSQGTKVPVQDLSTPNASWTAVIGGKAICQPQNTSYGFAVLTDGKMISACSNNGVKLWEQPVPGKPDPFLTVFSSDFLLSVNDKKNLSLINPSGLTLWTKKVPFNLTCPPSCGRDSRIFVKGKKNIACYGLNGVCKWTIETPALRDLPLYEMNDGSLLAVLDQANNGKTSGIRITPFGEIIETINFAGLVKNARTLPGQGILLVFTGNGAGLCSVKDGQTITKWAIPSEDKAFSGCVANSGSDFLLLNNAKSALAVNTGSSTRIMVFNNSDGRVSDFYDIPVSYSNQTCCSVTNDGSGIFMSDNRYAVLFSHDGTLRWKGKLPSSGTAGSWNYLGYTNSNHLILCTSNWVVNGYRTTQSLTKKSKTSAPAVQKPLNYKTYYTIDTSYLESYNFTGKIEEDFLGKGRIQQLRKGGYGKEEAVIASDLLSLSRAYGSYLTQSNSGARPDFRSVFETDSTGVQEFINQISLMGTDDYPKILANLIKNEPKDDNLKSLLVAAGTCGYDPDGSMLNAIDNKMMSINARRSGVLIVMCDSVYEICRFMGRPALYDHGIKILSTLLYPQYDSTVRDKARETLIKISSLRI